MKHTNNDAGGGCCCSHYLNFSGKMAALPLVTRWPRRPVVHSIVLLLLGTSTSHSNGGGIIFAKAEVAPREDVTSQQHRDWKEEEDDVLLPLPEDVAPAPSATTIANTEEEEHVDAPVEQQQQEEQDQCRLYLGPSSIPNAGLGMYTSIPIPKGGSIGEPELLVTMPEIGQTGRPFSLIEEVFWNEYPQFAGETSEILTIFYPGFGAAVNCHMGLNNIANNDLDNIVDSTGLHRRNVNHVGVGAFTYNHGVMVNADGGGGDIEAGSELFVDYGEEHFESRQDRVGIIPFKKDYKKADKIVRAAHVKWNRMGEVMDEKKKKNETTVKEEPAEQARQDAWDMIRDLKSERVQMALPTLAIDIPHAADVGTAKHSLPNFIRTNQWLRTHAMCVDNIYPSTSTLPSNQAGRGAFAKRLLREGSAIAPAPVLHLRRSDMELKAIPQSTKQLVLNYCYGHPNGEVLLLPYSPTVNFINHNQTLANAAIRWITDGGPLPHPGQEWLTWSPEQVFDKEDFGLVMEIVALRDIHPNEEIFLDYGNGWEMAWQTHVRTYVPPPNSDKYMSSQEIMDDGADLRTHEEQRTNPYPSNVDTMCYYQASTNNPPNNKTGFVTWTEDNKSTCLRPCMILSRETTTATTTNNGEKEEEYTYSAKMLKTSVTFDECGLKKGERHVQGLPRHTFLLVDKVHTRDQYLPTAFRHEIGLPEGVYPSAWLV